MSVVISCVQFSGIVVVEEKDGCGYRMKGEKVTLALLQKSISVVRWAAWWPHEALTAPDLKRYTCCETWRLLAFVVQKHFKCWILWFRGSILIILISLIWFGALRFGQCISNLNVLLVERWIDVSTSKCSPCTEICWVLFVLFLFFLRRVKEHNSLLFFSINAFHLCLEMVPIEFLLIHKAVVSMKLS